jgi:hypothetical protein
MAITFVITDKISDKLEITAELQREHWEETARNKHLMVLDPATEIYAAIEREGGLFAVLAYDGEEMIGYSVNLLSVNLHYSSLYMATNDVLFVAKPYRVGRTPMRLIDETERVAAEYGARMMLWHAKEDTALSQILPRRGCKVQDIIYSKELYPTEEPQA